MICSHMMACCQELVCDLHSPVNSVVMVQNRKHAIMTTQNHRPSLKRSTNILFCVVVSQVSEFSSSPAGIMDHQGLRHCRMSQGRLLWLETMLVTNITVEKWY